MFGYTIIKESELLKLRMHKRLSDELLESIRPIRPFIREIGRLCCEKPEYLTGMKQGIVGIHFLKNHSPFPKHTARAKQ